MRGHGATQPGVVAVAVAVAVMSVVVGVVLLRAASATASAPSATIVTGAPQANAEEAIDIAERTDPSVLAPSTTATLQERTVKPALGETGVEITTDTTLVGSTISKDTPGEFAVTTPDGEFSLQPIATAPDATTTPTIVNGAAAVFASTATATDTIVRPDALGVTALLQLRSPEAPSTFSWEVGLGAYQQLEALPDGGIAVTEPESTSVISGPLPQGLFERLRTEAAETPGVEDGGGNPAEEGQERSGEESAGSETPPFAPRVTTPQVTPKSGEQHPQETRSRYEAGLSFFAEAKAHTANRLLLVIEPPVVLDAAGVGVPATLSVAGDTVTMTLSPGKSTAYPVTAATAFAGSNASVGTPAFAIRYGLSDPKPESFEKAEEEPGKIAEHFDAHLESGPLHVKIARDVISYDPTSLEEKELIEWLKAVYRQGLEPYVTFGVLRKTNCPVGTLCPGDDPSARQYGESIKRVVENLKRRHESEPEAVPFVKIWGAWNEPDFHSKTQYDPLDDDAKKAALFWKEGRATLEQLGCNCTMVAGEFAEYDNYISRYLRAILHNHSFWSRKPHVWGFHDYHDLAHVSAQHPDLTAYASDFVKTISKGTGHPRIWLSEQGVELNNGATSTRLSQGAEAGELQRLAAHDFLHLHTVSELYVEVADYYLYWGPSKAEEEQDNDKFDSGLLNGKEKSFGPQSLREAYCVVALGKESCPPSAATLAP